NSPARGPAADSPHTSPRTHRAPPVPPQNARANPYPDNPQSEAASQSSAGLPEPCSRARVEDSSPPAAGNQRTSSEPCLSAPPAAPQYTVADHSPTPPNSGPASIQKSPIHQERSPASPALPRRAAETPTPHSAARSPPPQSARTAGSAPSADAPAETAAQCNTASVAARSHPACAQCKPEPPRRCFQAAASATEPSPTAPAPGPPTCTSLWRQCPSPRP